MSRVEKGTPGEQRKMKNWGKQFFSKLDWSRIKEMAVVNIVFRERGRARMSVTRRV